MIEDYADRHIPFDGCFNFRDVGGYPTSNGKTVRWGKYFRAGRQDRMTPSDLNRLRKLGIRTQVDLRKQDEINEQGRGPLETIGAIYHHIPVIPEGGSAKLSHLVGDTGISGKHYLAYLEFGPETWLRMFEIFANDDQHPIVLHCTAGKDRTGVSTAFLLSVLGVDRRLIEADYILTNRDVPRQADFIETHVGLPEGMDRQTMMYHAGVPDTAMHDFLNGLDARWGGVLGYLSEIGVTQDTINAVRSHFLV